MEVSSSELVFQRLPGPRQPPVPQHRSRRWSRRFIIVSLVSTFLLLLVLVLTCQPASAGVRSVTAYYDPFWKSRTKRTTAQVQPSYYTHKYFNSTQSIPSTTTTVAPQESLEIETTLPTPSKQKQRRYRVLGGTKTWVQRPKPTTLPTVLQVQQTHELNSTFHEENQEDQDIQEISPTDEQPSEVVRRRRVSSSAQDEIGDQISLESVSNARYRPLGLEQADDTLPEKYYNSAAPIAQRAPAPAAYKTHDNNDDTFWDSMTQGFPKIIMDPEEEPPLEDYVAQSNRDSKYNSYNIANPGFNGLSGGDDHDHETDLELGESINPFINSSTPIANDLRGSYPNHHLDFLHPLFNSDNDFGTPFKVPENKSVAIEHTLSDQSIGVKVAPDLHHELAKSQFPLNPDGILTSDHDRQLQKTFPKVHVKTSVSMSTSSSSSSSKSSGGGAKKTTPMPVHTFNIPMLSSAEDSKKKLKDMNNKPVTRLTIQFSTTPRPYTGETSTTLLTQLVKASKTQQQQSSITKLTTTQAPPPPAKPLFTLRPKVAQTTTTTTTRVPWTVRSTTTTSKPSTQETSIRSSSSSENINTFFDNIDEINGKNKWSPPTSTTSTTTSTTPKPTDGIKPNREAPLLLMPPFTNDKDQPIPVTLTTKSATTEKPRSALPPDTKIPPALPSLQGLNDAALLQQLLGILGEQSNGVPQPQTTRKPTTTTTTTRRPPPTTPRTAATQADILSLLSLFGQQPQQTQKPRTPTKSASSSSSSLNTNDLLSLLTQPQSNGASINSNSANDLLSLFGQQPKTQRPAPTRAAPAPQATSNNDILSLLSLFQTTTTRRPAQQLGGGAAGDLLGLFNLFGGGGARATTTPAPLLGGFLGNIGTFFNAFRPQTTTPRPASNDLFGGLFNLFTTPAPRTVATKSPTRPAAASSSNAGALDALVQQALLESLGLPGQASNSISSQRAIPASKPTAATSTTTRPPTTTRSTTTVAPAPKTTKSDTLSDEEIREIFKILEKQEGKSSTTTTTTTSTTTPPATTTPRSATRTRIVPTTPAPAYSTRATTTLMPIFRNMLNLFGITDPPQADASSQSSVKVSPVFNPFAGDKSAAAATNEDLLLKLINSNQAFNNVVAPTTKAPEQQNFDLLSQLLNLGQVVQNVQASTVTPGAPLSTTPPPPQSPPLDIQSILAQSWLQQRPETSPSESNFLHLISNQFTPKPQKPNGLYYWVDLNAFTGDQTNNPMAGIRPKLGQKDYFVKVKRQTLPGVDSQGRRTLQNGNGGYYINY